MEKKKKALNHELIMLNMQLNKNGGRTTLTGTNFQMVIAR